MTGAARRRLRRQARDLLRPGRHVADLHAELVAVQRYRELWSLHCPAGGWPRLPDSMGEIVTATREVCGVVDELDPMLRHTVGDGATALVDLPIEELAEHLLALAEDEAVARSLPERTEAVAHLTEAGLAPLLADLAARRVPLTLVTAELDLAWWSSVLEQTIVAEPALRGARSYAADVERLRTLDRAQVDSLVPPVALATAKNLRALAVADKPNARDLFRAAELARRGKESLDLLSMRRDLGEVGRAVVPCWSVPALLVPQVIARPPMPADPVVVPSPIDEVSETVAGASPDGGAAAADSRAGGDGGGARLRRRDRRNAARTSVARAAAVQEVAEAQPPEVSRGQAEAVAAARFDVVVLDSVQNLTTAQVVSAVARGDQVVLVGDLHRGGTGAVAELARVLPRLALDGGRTDRDESLTSFLADHGYGEAVLSIPSPPGPPAIRLQLVDGRALAVHGGVVETVPEEVEEVVDLVIEHALARPEQSLAVVALNARHALRVREAVAEAVAGSPAVAAFFDPARTEPFAVVDVEQAAGMRRDAVILAVGYGKTPHGRVIHQFGAVSSPRGVSLLVDVIEACRRQLVVTSCVAPEELDVSRLRSEGSRMLADLLAFAASGGALPMTRENREGDPDPLLVDLADRLWRVGLDVLADYGPPGGVRLPLVVGHPSLPGRYRIAILTDTPEYVATPSLRVRDRYWVERLERRGWSVVVLSSLDVFLDPQAAANRVLGAVSELVRNLPPAPSAPVRAPRLEADADADDLDGLDGMGEPGGSGGAGSAVGGGSADGGAEATDAGEGVETAQGVDGPTGTEGGAAERGPRPDVFTGLPIGAYSMRELNALAAWILSDGEVRELEALAAELRSELGLPDDAARVEEVLTEVAGRVLAPQEQEEGTAEADEEDDVTAEVDGGAARTAAEIAQDNSQTQPLAPPVLPDRAWEDDDRAWGDAGDDDDRILRERPPHWG